MADHIIRDIRAIAAAPTTDVITNCDYQLSYTSLRKYPKGTKLNPVLHVNLFLICAQISFPSSITRDRYLS